MSEFRFTFDPQFTGETMPYVSETFSSYDFAESMLNQIAKYTIHLHETALMPDYKNYGFIEQKVDGKWVQFEEE